jgi:sugar-specific transcriptional regulator TrmB
MEEANVSVIDRLVDSGLEQKEARVLVALAAADPLKASEIGRHVGITRMDAYNTLRRLQDRGLVMATIDKPMRFTALPISEVFQNFIFEEEA